MTNASSMKDIRGFLALLEESGDLASIKAEVDPVLEIAEITNRVCKQKGGGKALLFKNVKGYKIPVATNLFGSFQRIAWALWSDHLQQLADRVGKELKAQGEGDAETRLRRLVEKPENLPRLISSPPCQEVVIQGCPDLGILPALKSWPGDGGHFLTLPLVFTRDPGSKRRNCGMYRVQIFGKDRAGLHWAKGTDGARQAAAWQARNKPMPVAIALGGDMVMTYAATAPLPTGVEEASYAGYLRQMPMEMARCVSCELEVPAAAEFVIEGYVQPGETMPEGPFGNHTGYYAPPEPAQVLRVTVITHRKDPIYPCTVVGPPPMENCYLAKATERLFLPMLQIDHPSVVDLNMPLEGIFHGCAVISIRKEVAGQGRKIIRELWTKGFLKKARFMLILDEDVRVQDLSESFWRTINHLDPGRDIIIDGNRIGIDATRKGPDEGLDLDWPPTLAQDEVTRMMVDRRWQEYGIAG